MSIASDVRSYADSALGQAETRLTEVRGDATELASTLLSRAAVTYTELRTRGEELTKRASTLPGVERASASVEPYVAQLMGYGTVAAEKLEQAYAELRKNDQLAKVITATETSIDAVQERVTSLLDRRPTGPAPASAPVKAPAKATPSTKAKQAAKAAPAASAKASAKASTAKAAPAKASAAKATPAKRTTTQRATEA